MPTQSTTVATVSQCVIPAAAAGPSSGPSASRATRPTPAAARRPAARRHRSSPSTASPVTDWDQLTDLIRAAGRTTVQLDVRPRTGSRSTKAVPIVADRAAHPGRRRPAGRRRARRLPRRLRARRRTSPQSLGAAHRPRPVTSSAPPRRPWWPSRPGSRRCGTRSSATTTARPELAGRHRRRGPDRRRDPRLRNTSATDKVVLFLQSARRLQHEPVPAQHAAAAAAGRRAHPRRDDRVGPQGLGEAARQARSRARSTWPS